MSSPPPSPELTPNAEQPRKAVHRRARFQPRAPGTEDSAPDGWSLSYADMVTLLLTMFVSLLLNASFDKTKPREDVAWPRQVIENLLRLRVVSPYSEQDGFMISGLQEAVPNLPAGAGAALAVVKDEDLERIRRREDALNSLRERLRAARLDDVISAVVEGDGIRLNIPNAILFNTGEAALQGRGPFVIRTLAPLLATGQDTVSVEGHTDDVPIKTERYPSNWELSAQRAAAVVRELAEAGVAPPRLQAVGYADSRPLTNNTTEGGRRENRRVTLLLRTP